MKNLSYAFRNVVRSSHRSLVTISAMAFAGFIMIFYAALMEGVMQATEKNIIGMELGEFQVHARGYRQDPDLYNRINNEQRVVQAIERQGFYAATRLFGAGLAAAGAASSGVTLRGVDLEGEQKITRIHNHLLAGTWLDKDDPHGVVLGRKLARTLAVNVGDEVLVVSQAADGSMANDLYRVRGILKSVGARVDGAGFFMVQQAFRDLMVVPEGVHEIVVVRRDPGRDLDACTKELARLLPDYEVLNWRELQPVLARVVDISRYSLLIMLLVTYTAVGILTLNAMLMSVFERIREFGIMKALGLSPLRVCWLIVCETALQVSIAVVLALVTAVPLSLYCEQHPLDFSGLAKTSSTIAGVALDPVWYCRLTMDSVLYPVGILYGVSAVAILYPAVKAAFIRPVQAIYHR